MSDNKKGRFCIVPFIQLNTRGQGNLRVCCSISGIPHGIPKNGTIIDVNEGRTGGPGDTFDLRKDSIDEVWNCEFMRDFRLRMARKEYLSNCEHCYRLEDRGVDSKRVNRNNKFAAKFQSVVDEALANDGQISTHPIWWELRFSTKCNLSCRMCTPALSTRMLQEYKAKADQLTPEMRGEMEMATALVADGHLGESQYFRDQLQPYMEKARFLEMRGGEVLVDPEAIDFLRDLSLKKKWAANMHLDLSSNIVTLNEEHIEIFNGFNSGTIKCSVDAFAEENEYIRFPSKWTDTVQGLRKLKGLHSRWSKVLQATLSAYQVCTIDRLLWFLDEFVQESGIEMTFSFTMVRDTPHLDPELIPLEMRKAAAHKVEVFLEKSYLCSRSPHRDENRRMVRSLAQGLLQSEELRNSSDLKAFVDHTRALDQMRSQSVLSVFPHLEPLLTQK
ncbi:MAG: twitch domain-containing radical SAM protein [Bdellovibrionales bacterium]|nr:twitch domain-containing radical SAM protein [Bdellovibrionales bacterium]